jgi:hypothetical protein
MLYLILMARGEQLQDGSLQYLGVVDLLFK